MENRIQRYSRILIPLPPVLEIKDKVTKLVEEEFKITPEYVETDWCEGYAIGWGSWYGFDNLRFPSMRSFFPLQLKRILDDWLGDEEEAQVIEWIDEDRWEWMDIVKDADEIFHANYWRGNINNIMVFEDGLRFHSRRLKTKAVMLNNIPELMKPKFLDFHPIFKVLARRGYWNGIEGRDKFYERIGYDFALPFK
jgi:hypothetical protein